MLTSAAVLAAVDTAHDGGSILCTLLLIGAVIATIASLFALLGPAFGPRFAGTRNGGYLGGPVFVAVVLWVIYFVAC